MGLSIKVTGADYSSVGLGTTNWLINYFNKVGLTDTTKQTAVTNFYNSAVSAGLWNKLKGVCFFPGTNVTTQKSIFREDLADLTYIEGQAGEASKAAHFVAGGFISDLQTTPTSQVDRVTFRTDHAMVSGDTSAWSMGVWNITPGRAIGDPVGGDFLMGVTSTRFGSDANTTVAGGYSVWLSRMILQTQPSNYTTGAFSSYSSVGQSLALPSDAIRTATYDTGSTKTGFLQFAKEANGHRILIDNTTTVVEATNTGADPIFGDGNLLNIGSIATQNTTGRNNSRTTIAFAYWGTLSAADLLTFYPIVQTFLSAYGRI